MKTYNQRTESILQKVKYKKRIFKNAVMAGITCLSLTALIVTNAVWLMPDSPFRVNDLNGNGGNNGGNTTTITLPDNNDSSLLQSASSYSDVYTALNSFYSAGNSVSGDVGTDGAVGETPDSGASGGAQGPQGSPGVDGNTGSSNAYQEVTNNQVDGVIEADLFKRSDDHIFYLKNTYGDLAVRIYSIDGENSQFLSAYDISGKDMNLSSNNAEMYLSADAKTLTVITPCYKYDSTKYYSLCYYTMLINLNVENVENVSEINRVYLSGNYITSRYTKNGLLVMSNFYTNNCSKDSPKTYIPHAICGNEEVFIKEENVLLPERISVGRYTYINLLNPEDLSIDSSKALLSYTSDVYVSENNIYVNKEFYPYFSQEIDGEDYVVRMRKSDIACLNYGEGSLEFIGNATVNGYVDDQYSLDEKDGVLRVFTSTQAEVYSNRLNKFCEVTDSASLYCINLNDFETFAKVENFAPHGESVRSARFDGNTAYVCTAVQFTDPVFAFDLSNYNNITYTDTGTINGYSLSLAKFYNNTLLGIGYGDASSTLKIEVYKESETTVESVDKREWTKCFFSSDFKAYYINAEEGLVGVGARHYTSDGSQYIYHLLKFDGKRLVLLKTLSFDGSYNLCRATLVDGYFYLLSYNSFTAVAI